MTAVSHPLRRQILRAYLEEGLASASAADIARLTDQPVARVGYHMRTLAQCKLLRLVALPREHWAGGRERRWVLDAEGDWVQLLLDIWAQTEPTR